MTKTLVAAKCLRSILVLVLLCGCKSLFATGPYSLFCDSPVLSDRMAYGYGFKNNSEKSVVKVELVLSLYDSDGEPVFDTDWITVEVPLFTEPGTVTQDQIDLSPYITDLPEDFATDYFYASKIWYQDGTLWQDPYGRYAE